MHLWLDGGLQWGRDFRQYLNRKSWDFDNTDVHPNRPGIVPVKHWSVIHTVRLIQLSQASLYQPVQVAGVDPTEFRGDDQQFIFRRLLRMRRVRDYPRWRTIF